MGIRQTLTRVGLGLACAALPALTVGCHTTRKISTQVTEVLEGPPQPATSVGCMWKKQIAYLPDPTRDGVQGAGIHGIMHLYGADGMSTRADGNLQVMAYDETPRVAGQAPCKPSMWHFDPATLKKLRTKDSGLDCYLLFLPWPQDWKDVSKVRLQVKYSPKGEGGTNVFTTDQVMAFEIENQPGQNGLTQASMTTAKKSGIGDKQGIPDLKKTMDLAMGKTPPVKPLANATTGTITPMAPQGVPMEPALAQPVVTVGHVVPVTPTAPLQLPPNTEPILSQEPAPMPRPTPPPPPMMPQPVPVSPAMPVVSPKAETVNVTVGEGLPSLVIPAAK